MKLKIIALSVFTLIVDHISLNSQSTVIPTLYQTFGDGYNSSTERFSSEKVINVNYSEDEYILNNSADSRSYTLNAKIYTSTHEKRELSHYLVSASAGVNVGKFSASVSFTNSKNRTLVIKDFHDYLALELVVYSGTKSLKNPGLTEKGIKILGNKNGSTQFLNMYGDEFVKHINYGSKLIIIVEAKNKSLDEKNTNYRLFQAAAKYWKASASFTELSTEQRNDINNVSNMDIYILANGVDGTLDLPDFDMVKLKQYAKEFIKSHKNVNTIVSVGTEKINKLLTNNTLNIKSILDQKSAIDSLNLILNANLINLNNAQHYLENYNNSSFRVSRDQASNLLEELRNYEIENDQVAFKSVYKEKSESAADLNLSINNLQLIESRNDDENGNLTALIVERDNLNKLFELDPILELEKYINLIIKINEHIERYLILHTEDVGYTTGVILSRLKVPDFKPLLLEEPIPTNEERKFELSTGRRGGYELWGMYRKGAFDLLGFSFYNRRNVNAKVVLEKYIYDKFRSRVPNNANEIKINYTVYDQNGNRIDHSDTWNNNKTFTIPPKGSIEVEPNLEASFGTKNQDWPSGNLTRVFPWIRHREETYNFVIRTTAHISYFR